MPSFIKIVFTVLSEKTWNKHTKILSKNWIILYDNSRDCFLSSLLKCLKHILYLYSLCSLTQELVQSCIYTQSRMLGFILMTTLNSLAMSCPLQSLLNVPVSSQSNPFLTITTPPIVSHLTQ